MPDPELSVQKKILMTCTQAHSTEYHFGGLAADVAAMDTELRAWCVNRACTYIADPEVGQRCCAAVTVDDTVDAGA